VALEMARLLVERGEQVERVVLVGSAIESLAERGPIHRAVNRLVAKMARMRRALGNLSSSPRESATEAARRRERLQRAYLAIDRRYRPRPVRFPVALFWANDDPAPVPEIARQWRKVAPELEVHVLPGTHSGSLTRDVKILAEHLTRCLASHG
jgi:thioesterase domain-containing protein